MINKIRIPLSQVFAVLLFALILFSKSYWDNHAPLVRSVLFFAGISMAGIASLGRLWCSLYIAGYKTATLITEGPYSMSRNPLYFFSMIGALGVGLATETFLIPVAIVITFALYYPAVIKSEEAELQAFHQEAFRTYCRQVPKFFPNIKIMTEPETYIVKPKVFRRHMFDAFWFIGFIGVMEVIEDLHEQAIIPTWFQLF